jgi:phage tail-like protein
LPQFSVNPERFDPYKQFKFRIKWDGRYVPGICRVSGLVRKTDVIIHREGGDPSSSRQSPGATSYEPIQLLRGRTHDNMFEEWAKKVWNHGEALGSEVSLKDFRKDITIELLNESGQLVMAFKVFRCWPSEYTPLGELDATRTSVSFESITLQHEGWERDTSISEPTEP